jgi:hypothetical protein
VNVVFGLSALHFQLVTSQTDFLIVSHVDRTGPPNSPDLDPCDYFLWEFLKEKVFPKELQPVWN